MNPDIYSYIKEQESNFETNSIELGDNWTWNLRDHVQLIFHLKNGVFYTGSNDWLRAFKGIMEPILNLSYWTEDIEVKDVTFFIEEENGKVLSFLLKKYHDEVYTREHDLDTFFDEVTESDIDYGGALVQKGTDMPEVLPLNSVAFGDQTDLKGGPIGFKMYFSPDKLRGMSEFGWGKESNGATVTIDELCILAQAEKDSGALTGNKNKVPGKVIEVYIVRGNLPDSYLNENGDDGMSYNQLHIVAFYTKKNGEKKGVTLYKKKEDEGNLKVCITKKVYMRGLGRGVGEMLLPAQVWTNFLEIHKMNMLEAASKIPLQTDDENYTTRNKIQDMENLEVTVLQDGKRIEQIPTAAPANIQLFSQEINAWYDFAQITGAAFDPLMGKEASSGTTFRGQERVVAQGQGLHDRRRGQRAKFIEEVYRDWIIPDIRKGITENQKFLVELSTEELTWVADQLANNEANNRIKQTILNGGTVSEEGRQFFIQQYKSSFLKKGNKTLIEILGDEFQDIEIRVGINVVGKQKNLVQLSDKLLSIFQFIFANPLGFQNAMQIPALAKSFENLLEFGGMSIGDFSSLLKPPPQQVQAPQQGAQGQGGQQQGVQPSPIAPLPLQPSAF